MNVSAPARATVRQTPRLLLAGLAFLAAAHLGSFGDPAASSSAMTSRDRLPGGNIPGGNLPGGNLPTDIRGALGEADGLIPDGASVFDETPAVANLDPRLLKALRRAATDAARDGIELRVTSGWRSPEYQDQLFRAAAVEYGSEEEAARWVATASTSAHVSGDAVDIGSADATGWLSEHGADFGLCQIYRNEPWHYELRPEAIGGRCPRMYVDSAHDPRMQQ